MRTATQSTVVMFDPGFAFIGAAAIRLASNGLMDEVLDLEVWTTEKSDKKRSVRAVDDDVRRAREIARRVLDYFEVWAPAIVGFEAKSSPRNASASAKISKMLGVVICEAERRRLPVVQATPAEVRESLALPKKATKEEIEHAMKTRLRGNWELFESRIDARSRVERTADKTRAEYRSHGFDAAAAFVACANTEIVRALRGRFP